MNEWMNVGMIKWINERMYEWIDECKKHLVFNVI